MEKKHEITEKQLVFLQDYIKRKKRFSDQEDLYELIDHLVSDFEATGNGNLSQYLADNSEFIFNYKVKDTNKYVHLSYQRQLWTQFFDFFIRVKYIPITFLTVVSTYILFYEIELSNKYLTKIFFILIGILLISGLIKSYHKKKQIRKLVSFQYLGNILALPQVFLYSFTPIKDFLFEYRTLLFLYIMLAFGLNLAGVLLITEKREIILKKYNHLLN